MAVIIKKSDSKETLDKLLTKLQSKRNKKGVDTSKYCGVINLKEDPLEIQRKLRDEWD